MGRKAVGYLFYNVLIVITLLLGVSAVVGWGAGHVSPHDYYLLSFVGLAMLGILFANVLFLIYWAARRRWWIVVPILALGLNYQFIAATLQLPHKVDVNLAAQADKIRVATYNVHNFSSDTYPIVLNEVASYIVEQGVDLFCVQEFWETSEFSAARIAEMFELPYYSRVKDSINGIDVATFSRYPIKSSSRSFFPDSGSSMLVSDIEVNGEMVRVVNTHLQTTSVSITRRKIGHSFIFGNSSAQRDAIKVMTDSLTGNFLKRSVQAEIIARLVEKTPHPVIVCGDFNDTPASYAYKVLTKSGLTDSFISCGSGYGYTYRAIRKLLRIDYILYSEQFTGVDYQSPLLEWSDHNPVIVDLVLQRN